MNIEIPVPEGFTQEEWDAKTTTEQILIWRSKFINSAQVELPWGENPLPDATETMPDVPV